MARRHDDPTGKAALFGPAVAPGTPNEGKAALFSSSPRRRGTVVIECADCLARTRVSLADLAVRLGTGSVWFPLRRHQHWLRCPACGRRRWCRIGWTD